MYFPRLRKENIDTSRTSASIRAMTSAATGDGGMGQGRFFHLHGGGYCHFPPPLCCDSLVCGGITSVVFFVRIFIMKTHLFVFHVHTHMYIHLLKVRTYIYILKHMYVYIIGCIGCRSENLDQNYLDQNILAKKNRMQRILMGSFVFCTAIR